MMSIASWWHKSRVEEIGWKLARLEPECALLGRLAETETKYGNTEFHERLAVVEAERRRLEKKLRHHLAYHQEGNPSNEEKLRPDQLEELAAQLSDEQKINKGLKQCLLVLEARFVEAQRTNESLKQHLSLAAKASLRVSGLRMDDADLPHPVQTIEEHLLLLEAELSEAQRTNKVLEKQLTDIREENSQLIMDRLMWKGMAEEWAKRAHSERAPLSPKEIQEETADFFSSMAEHSRASLKAKGVWMNEADLIPIDWEAHFIEDQKVIKALEERLEEREKEFSQLRNENQMYKTGLEAYRSAAKNRLQTARFRLKHNLMPYGDTDLSHVAPPEGGEQEGKVGD